MGLDGVELVMTVEDEFQIVIPDDDAEKLVTVGMLVDYVHAKCPREPFRGCRSAHTFYRVRAVLVEALDLPRREIRPATALAAIVPPHRRRAVWAAMKAHELPLQSLRRPRSLVVALIVTVLVGAAGAAIATGSLLGTLLFWLCALGGGVVALWASAPWERRLPDGYTNVGHMALSAVRSPPAGMSRAEVAHRIREIVAEQMGIAFDTVTEDKRFADDLGVGG